MTVYRLDRIKKLELDTTKIRIDSTDKINIYPNVWGMNFNSKPEKVKIRFYNEGNVWNKVKADLSYRINGSLYEKNGFLYYEDIVYGIESFRTWIYSFGSSAIVIEPESLRNQIIDSLKVRSERLLSD